MKPIFTFITVTCLVSQSLTLLAAAELPQLDVAEMVTGLHRPTSITHSGDGSGRLFVTEQTGTVRIIAGGKILEAPFLDISGKVTRLDPICCDERGLLSLAFAPNFAQSRGRNRH